MLKRPQSLTVVLLVAVSVGTPIFSLHAAEAQTKKQPTLTLLERTSKPLLKADRPWEDFCIGFCQVLRVNDQWHMWYYSSDHTYKQDDDGFFCYARSKNGVDWQKPSLGMTEYNGNKDNNILARGHCLCSVFFDEKAPTLQRFKTLAIRMVKGQWWIYGGTSPDGLHWKWIEKPLLAKNADTANVCIRDGNTYRLYVRMWSGAHIYSGYRVIGYTESPTFGSFPDPKPILAPDKSDPVDFHLYNPATTKLRDDLYLMLPSGFFTKTGKVMVCAAFSRDGKHFERLDRKPLLELGKGFDKTGMYVGPGAIPGDKPGAFWFYYSGTAVPHDENLPNKVHFDGGIGRFLVELKD